MGILLTVIRLEKRELMLHLCLLILNSLLTILEHSSPAMRLRLLSRCMVLHKGLRICLYLMVIRERFGIDCSVVKVLKFMIGVMYLELVALFLKIMKADIMGPTNSASNIVGSLRVSYGRVKRFIMRLLASLILALLLWPPVIIRN